MKRLCLLLAGFFCLGGTARAADMYRLGAPQTAKFGLFTGAIAGGDTEKQDRVFGLQLVYHATQRLSVELAGTLFSDELQVPLSDQPLRFSGETDLNNQTVSLTARYAYPLTHAIAAYGGAGICFYRFDPDNARAMVDSETLDEGFFVTSSPVEVKADSEYGFQVAAGLQAALSRNIELFGEYRYILLDRTVKLTGTVNTRRETVTVEQTETGPGAETVSVREQSFTASDTASGSYNHGMFRVGLNFYF